MQTTFGITKVRETQFHLMVGYNSKNHFVCRRKRKEVGKDPKPDEPVVEIDEYLGMGQIGIKKPTIKFCQPDNEFWEDYVHFTKTTGTAIKKQQKLRPESSLTCSFGKKVNLLIAFHLGNVADVMEESYQDDINDDNNHYDPPDENMMDTSGGLGEFLYLEIARE